MVRQELRQAQDWRAVIDAIRPVTQQLWQALPFNEQKRFLRHIKAYWEVHRHRIAEGIARRLLHCRWRYLATRQRRDKSDRHFLVTLTVIWLIWLMTLIY